MRVAASRRASHDTAADWWSQIGRKTNPVNVEPSG
jgi:hypothetical protein